MKAIKPFIQSYVTNKSVFINLTFALISIIILGSSINTNSPHFKSIFIFIAFAILIFSENKTKNSYLWSVLIILFLIDLRVGYFKIANHHFLLLYTTLVIYFYLKNWLTYRLVETNIKCLTAIVLLFAGLQKLFSTEFLNGDYYYYMINTGKFFTPILKRIPSFSEIINQNTTAIKDLALTNPNELKVIKLEPIHNKIKSFTKLFSWITISYEIFAAILILFKPKHLLTHVLFIALIIGVFLTRLETGFLTLLSIFGFVLVKEPIVKIVYSAMALFFMALIVCNLGYY